MEFRDAVKHLRNELGLTQTELSGALHVTPVTIGRWERGENIPNRSITAALLSFARSQSASRECLAILKDSIDTAAKEKRSLSGNVLYSVEHASLRELVDEAAFPLYVCDMHTDELLYINEKAEEMIGRSLDEIPNRKCYVCLMHRDTPCTFCNKNELSDDHFICYDAVRLFNDVTYKVQGKRIKWNGRDAHVRYLMQVDSGKQLKSIIENMNGGVTAVTYDDDGGVRHAYRNDRYLELFGYTAEQYANELKKPYAIVSEEDIAKVRSVMEHIRSTGRPATFRFRANTRDGRKKYISCSSSLATIEGFGSRVMLSVMTDITAAVETEQQALVFGQRLNAIMGNINNGVAASILHKDGTVDYVFVTDRFYEIHGYTREQYHQEVTDPFQLIYCEDLDAVRKTTASLHKVNDSRNLKYRVVRRDGRVIWLDVEITMMSFADVEEPVQLAVLTDITHIMEAAEKIKAQRDEINEMLNTTPSGIAVVEIDPKNPASMHTTYYNDRFFSFSGCTREEYDAIIKENETSFVFEEDVPVMLADIVKICAGDIGTSKNTTIRCHTKDGGYRWLLLTGQLAEKRGDTCVLKVSLVDITARKDAEDRQRIGEEMLRLAAETDKRALITYDVKANACHVESRNLYSAGFGETLTSIPESLIERKIVAQESVAELNTLFSRIRSGESRLTVSLQLRTGETEYQWFECNASVVFDADHQPDHAVLVFHNITEQRIKEAVYRKWQNSIQTRPPASYTLIRSNLCRDASADEEDGELLRARFFGDLCTFNERTQEYAKQFIYPEDQKDYVALVNSDVLLSMFYRGEHVAEIEYRELVNNAEPVWRKLTIEMVEYPHSTDVQAFLLFEDIDKQKKEELKAQELRELDPLTGALTREAFVNKLEAIVKSEPALQHALLMLDMDGLKQLNDVFGYTAGDQSLVDVASVLRSISRKGDLVCRLGGDVFLVWQRDIPYDAAIEKAARQMCEQIRKVFSSDVKIGASIGIAVYPRDGRSFNELYGKADKALSKVKRIRKGSYAFYNATAQAQEQASLPAKEAATEQQTVPKRVDAAKRRMLIVDDSETTRALLQRWFQDEFLIETAKNGAEAMLFLKRYGSAISIVLLDLMMPDVDGYTVLQQMQENTDLRAVPVIVVSADNNRDTLLKAIEGGAADYITKPIDVDLIRIRVKAVISKMENEKLRAQNSYLLLQRDEEMKFQTVLESTGTVVVEYNWLNQVFIYDSTISNYIAGNYDNRRLWKVFLSDLVADSLDVKAMQEMMQALANNRDESKASMLVMLKTPFKVKHWFRMNVYKQVGEFGLTEKLFITFNDVHEEVLTNEKLLFQATRDELTGLYNRAGFIEKASQMIAAKSPGYYVMSCMDIERFKVINDQYGTEKGDEVLRQFAKVLSGLNSGKDVICCRVMADCFAALFPARLLDTSAVEANHTACELLDGSLPPLKIAAGRCKIDDKTLDVSAIYDRASIAKNTVKGRYDTYVAVYDESMRTVLLRQQEITGQMKQALATGQFEAWLQPQFNHSTGLLCGAEALVRWRHPKEGIISPAEFIPIFEKNGFVYQVDQYVWEETCKLLRKWIDQGLTPVPVSVNVSRYDVFRDDLIGIITGLVEKYRVPQDMLRLEITESAFSKSTAQIIRVVKELVELGFTVEIDDFGSGYSSLNTLKDVPAQVLKMDMRFLENDDNAQRGGSIIESVVRMARWLGMAVIAEGVETMEQADYLLSIGCENIQGYLYSRPVPAADYETYLEGRKTQSQIGSLSRTGVWNNNAFWNPASMETLIFNSYVGGACIFEYRNGKTELLRHNDRYAEVFRTVESHDDILSRRDILCVLDDENASIVRDNIETAIKTKKESTCESRYRTTDGGFLYVRTTVRQIAQTGDRYLFYCVVHDVTQQREAERGEREAASRTATLMDNITSGVAASVVRNGQIHYLFANDRYYEMLGYDKSSYAGKFNGAFFTIHPDDQERVKAVIAAASADLKPYTVEFRSVLQDGSIRWMICNINIISLPDVNEPVHLATVNDTTALHTARQKEQAAADRIHAIMNNATSGITAVVLHEDGTAEYLLVNKRYFELLGYTREQYEQEGVMGLELIHPDDRREYEKQIIGLNKIGQMETFKFRAKRRDGSWVWLQDDIAVISLKGVDAPVQLSCFSDITETREAQRKEHELTLQLQTIMANIRGGITITRFNQNGSIDVIFANDGFYEMYGYTKAQLEAEVPNILDVLLPEDREKTMETVKRIVQEGGSATYEYRCRKRDGSIMWTQATNSIISMDGSSETLLLAVATDITALKNVNTQLQFTNETAHDILSQPDCELAINEMLRKLLVYHQADRAYVVELDYENMLTNNTYEVCGEGVESQLPVLQSVPFSKQDYWYKPLALGAFFTVENVKDLPEGTDGLREMLAKQGIASIILAPLLRDGVLIGFAGVDNPKASQTQSQQLIVMGDYIAIMLTRRDLNRKVERGNAAIKLLIDDTPGGFCRMLIRPGETPKLVTFNKGFCRMLDMTEEEVRAQCSDDAYKCFVKEDVAASVMQARHARANEQQYSVRCRMRKKNGEYVWVMAFGRFINHVEDGNAYLNVYFTDISEQKTAEELQTSLMDHLTCSLALYEFDGTGISVKHYNKNYWKLLGHEPKDGNKINIMDLVHPEDKPVLVQEIVSSIRQNRDCACDLRAVDGKGVYAPFHVTATVEREKNGKYLLYAMHTPLSEKAMSVQEMFPIALSAMMATSDDISFVKDQEGRYIACSKTAAVAFGLTNEQDVIGKTSVEVFGESAVAQFMEEDHSIWETGKPILDRLVKLPTKDGATGVFCTSKYPLLDRDGKVVGIYSICRDVTKEKAMEFELNTLLRVIPSGVLKYAADETGTFAYINRSFMESLGYTEEQFRNKFHNRFLEMVWQEDRAKAQAEILKQEDGGAAGCLEYRVEAANGQLHWFHDEGVKVTDETGKAWHFVTLVDITAQKKSEESLRLAEEEYRLATRHSGHTIGRYDIKARTLTITEDAATRLALPECIPDVPYGRVRLGRVSEDTAAAYIAFYESIMQGKAEGTVTFRKLLSNGWRWITEHATTIFNEEGQPVSAIISYTDVTEQQEKELAYKKWQQSIEERDPKTYTLFRSNLNHTTVFDVWEGSLIPVKFDDTVKTFNDRTAAFIKQCVYEGDRERYAAFVNSDTMLAEYHRGHRTDSLEFRQKLENGGIRWLRLTVDLVESPHSTDVEVYLLYENIDEQKRAELETRHMAETDPLTGLLNRKAFFEIADMVIQNSIPGSMHAFFMLDIDGFKDINDTFGHAKGDEALTETARKLQALLRKDDLIGRLGGDEFVMLLRNIPHDMDLAKKAELIGQKLQKPFGAEMKLTVSLGICVCPNDGEESHALYEKADTALYAAKESGRNTFRIYTSDMPKKGAGANNHAMMAGKTE